MHISTCADSLVSSDAALVVDVPQHFQTFARCSILLRATTSICEQLLPQYSTWARRFSQHKELYDSNAGTGAARESQNVHLRIVL